MRIATTANAAMITIGIPLPPPDEPEDPAAAGFDRDADGPAGPLCLAPYDARHRSKAA